MTSPTDLGGQRFIGHDMEPHEFRRLYRNGVDRSSRRDLILLRFISFPLAGGKGGFVSAAPDGTLSVLALPELGVVDEGVGMLGEVGLIPPPREFSNENSPAPSPTLPLRIAQVTSSLNLKFSQRQQQRDSPTSLLPPHANGSSNGTATHPHNMNEFTTN